MKTVLGTVGSYLGALRGQNREIDSTTRRMFVLLMDTLYHRTEERDRFHDMTDVCTANGDPVSQ